MIEAWRRHYNEVRPHSSLGYLTPAAFCRKDQNRTPSGHDGADRCGMWGLRGPPRRPAASQGANRSSNWGSSLKLRMVRRIQAGQTLKNIDSSR